jgi:hypothetical protein
MLLERIGYLDRHAQTYPPSMADDNAHMPLHHIALSEHQHATKDQIPIFQNPLVLSHKSYRKMITRKGLFNFTTKRLTFSCLPFIEQMNCTPIIPLVFFFYPKVSMPIIC